MTGRSSSTPLVDVNTCRDRHNVTGWTRSGRPLHRHHTSPVIAASRHWLHLYHDRHGPPNDVPSRRPRPHTYRMPRLLDTAIIRGGVSAPSSRLHEGGGARSSITPLSVSAPLVTRTHEPPPSCREHSSAPRRTRRARGPAGPPAPLGPRRIRHCAAHPCSS